MSETLPPEFADKYGPWAVIAGGSEGVGESFARLLAGAGINLVILARRQAPLDALSAALRSEYRVEVRTMSVDLTDDELVRHVKMLTDGIDVGLLIYNAGSTIGYNRFPDWEVEDLDYMVRLNCRAPVRLAHHFSQTMCERGWGGMIFLSSLAAMAGSAWMSIYPATKAFDQVLAEGLWADLKPRGVDVMCLTLGATKTPSHKDMDFEALSPGLAMECDDAALEGLLHLGQGPLWVAGEQNRSSLPEAYLEGRAAAVESMSQATALLKAMTRKPD